METLKVFEEQQKKTIEALKKLLVFLQEGQELGVNINPEMIEKVENGIKETDTEKLKVSLIGGVSEGKTSIAAAWLERSEKTMKISQAESSDEVTVYDLDNLQLVDTPGLFGAKETVGKKRYKDIAKEYISSTHLLLYVMNPNNPIKESHKEELLWLFKELQLLPRTVFVLSRFDEEVDIEDPTEYASRLKIKKDNIIGRLRDFGVIDKNDSVDIVAVSANPFNKGIDYWLENVSEFKKLSHMDSLQTATTEKIKASGGKAEIVLAAQKSIVNDVLLKEMPIAEQRLNDAMKEYLKFDEIRSDIKNNLTRTERKISDSRISMREFILQYFTDLILQAKGTSLETINEFFERNIGDEGIVLDTRIVNEFERQLGTAYREVHKMQQNFIAGLEHYNSFVQNIAAKGLEIGINYLKGGTLKFTNTGILAARDLLFPMLKFKPWGAVKLASGLNKAIPIVGSLLSIGMEVWESFSKAQKEKEFKCAIDKMVGNFEKQRKEYIALLSDEDEFIRKFFPNYHELHTAMTHMEKEIDEKKQLSEQFKKWREQGEVIEVEFRS